MPKTYSIKLKLIATVLSLIVVMMLITGWLSIEREKNILREEAEKKGLAIARSLAIPCAKALAMYDKNQTDMYMAEMIGEKGMKLDIVYAMVLDSDGKVISHTDSKEFGKVYDDEIGKKAVASQKGEIQHFKDKNTNVSMVDVSVPLMTESLRWGTLRVGISLKRMEERIRLAIILIVITTLISTVVIVFTLFFILSKFVVNPILTLSKAAKQIGGGNLEYRVNINSRDELGHLAETFNTMSENLLESKSALERKILELSTLHEVSKLISSSLVLDTVLKILINSIMEVIHCDSCSLMLVDEETGELKIRASVGIDDKVVKSIKFKRGEGVAGWVLQNNQSVIINDTQKDERFKDVTSEIMSCMVVPLNVQGQTTGILSVDSKKKNAFSDDNLRLLTTLANDASIAMENAKLYEKVREQERMEQEIEIAQRIQSGLLPKTKPTGFSLDIAGRMKPAKEIGGDYYDFIAKDGEELNIVIGDVSGKGVPAGIYMVMARSILHSFLAAQKPIKDVIVNTNAILSKDLGNKFMSLLLMRWNENNKIVKYVGAGHERIIIYHSKEKKCEAIKVGGVALGLEPEISQFTVEKEIKLQPDDVIVLYTDGVTEAMNEANDFFTLKRLIESVEKHGDNNADKICDSILNDIYGFIGKSEQYDDITLVVAKYK